MSGRQGIDLGATGEGAPMTCSAEAGCGTSPRGPPGHAPSPCLGGVERGRVIGHVWYPMSIAPRQPSSVWLRSVRHRGALFCPASPGPGDAQLAQHAVLTNDLRRAAPASRGGEGWPRLGVDQGLTASPVRRMRREPGSLPTRAATS